MRLPKAINTPPTRRKWAQIASSRFNPLSTTRLHNPPNNTSWLTKSFTTREEEVYWTWNKVNCLRSVMPLSPFSSSFSFPHNLNAMCSLTCFEASSKVVLACNLLADHLLLEVLPTFELESRRSFSEPQIRSEENMDQRVTGRKITRTCSNIFD